VPVINPRQFSGSVVKRPFAAGSKSERQAILLVTDAGDYVLRRQGGNPFHDHELERLVGKRIRCTGTLTGYTLLVSECAVIPTE
jgi:hypothetical protein